MTEQPMEQIGLGNAAGAVNEFGDRCGQTLDDLDTMIATASAAPELLTAMPVYFLDALAARLGFLSGQIAAARNQSPTMEADPIRDITLSPELEQRSEIVRAQAVERLQFWAKGLDPDEHSELLAEVVERNLRLHRPT